MRAPRDDFDLSAELRALRPAPQPQFAAELDARAAAGFPRRRAAGSPGGRVRASAAGLIDRFRISPRRALVPAGLAAMTVLAVATAFVVSSEQSTLRISSDMQPAPSGHAGGASGRSGEELASGLTGKVTPQLHEFSRDIPKVRRLSDQKNFNGSFNDTGGVEVQSSSNVGTASAPSVAAPDKTGPYASQADHRDIERSAQMVLGTDAAEVRSAAAKVFDAVHSYDGIVLRSSIEDGDEGDAGAEFELLIPTAKLGDALASFSAIAEVRSRHESTADVTAKTVGLDERLQDSQATVESLLAQLAAADTEGERAAAQAELRSERLHVAALRARLTDLERRTNFSRVSLRIESGDASATGSEDDGAWGIGDALSDAGHILEVAAGIALIGLAILTPLALIGLLAWLARRTWVRRGRERALD